MPAHAVAGREAGTVDRRTHEGLAHARALGVQVVRRPLVGLVAEELHLALANLEQGIKDRAVLYELAGRVENRFVENLEAVAGLDFALEVYVEAEDVHHLHEDLVRHSRGERRVIEIGIDRADRPLQDALSSGRSTTLDRKMPSSARVTTTSRSAATSRASEASRGASFDPFAGSNASESV